MDALEELSDLSLALQKSDITIPAAAKLISREIEIFTARRDSDSVYYAEACDAADCGKFREVELIITAIIECRKFQRHNFIRLYQIQCPVDCCLQMKEASLGLWKRYLFLLLLKP